MNCFEEISLVILCKRCDCQELQNESNEIRIDKRSCHYGCTLFTASHLR